MKPTASIAFANRWHSKKFVSEWHDAAQRDRRDRSAHDFVASLVPHERGEEFRVMEILCGFGRLSRRVLAAFPKSQLVCVDYSQPMLRLAEENLRRDQHRIRFVRANLDRTRWTHVVGGEVGGDFEAIVSSCAVHDLSRRSQRRIYRDVFTLLKPGGCFFDYDIAWHDDLEANRHTQAILEREAKAPLTPELQKNNAYIRGLKRRPWEWMLTIEQRIREMECAGFDGVACYWRQLNRVVYGGFKPKV